MLYILHIVYITCHIFYILYILPIAFLHITFSFPYDDDGDEDKLKTKTTLTVFPMMLMMINEDDDLWRRRRRSGPMYRCEKNITDSRFTPLSGGPELTPLLLTTKVDGRTNSIRGGSVRPVYADDGTNPLARLLAAVLPTPVSCQCRLHRNRLF